MIYPIGPGWRVVGGFLESNVAGSFIAMMSVFGIALSSAGKSRWAINGGRIIFVLSLVALWGNGSRQALFYVPIGIGVCLLAQLLYRQRMSRFFLVIVIVFIASWLYSHYLVSPDYSLTEAVEDSGELGSRLARALEGEGLLALGGRKFACEDLISSLGWNNLLLGFGEGYGHDVGVGLGMLVSCHNAYLIVLLENGALAFLLLCFISIEMFIGTCRIPTSLFPGFSSEIELYRIVLPGWVVIWICSIFVNWTQMNMAACWPFLAVAIAVIYKKGDGSGHKARLMAV
ncbi:MAG: hypothetical protein GX577_08175 [Leptolinea sp.]|nr:hypothetical protein [Leptolinea sp.]